VIPDTRLVTSAAGTLAVREWSGGAGTPLVFWHALSPCASGAELVELAPRLVAGGLAPISVDGPGFGASPVAASYDLGSLAALLRATIRELGLDRPVLMGHSWGGGVVATLAGRHPEEVRGLVLVDSGHIDYADLASTRSSPDPVTLEWESRAAFTAWLEENLERTFAVDPYRQMGGYVKRCLGLRASIKLENPAGQRLQQLFIGDRPLQPERRYTAAFMTEQGVGQAYGRNRRHLPERAFDALLGYCASHRLVQADLRDTFVTI